MIADLKPYPAMKDSGVPWLGAVPEHWEVRRLASCLRSLESGSREQSDAGPTDGVASLGGEHVGTDGQLLLKNMRYVSRAYFASLHKGKIRERDVLLVKDGATIGKTALVRLLPYSECTVNEHVFIMRTADRCLPEFLYQNILSQGIQEAIWQQVTGSAQPGLNSSFTKGTCLCLPPLPEQAAIVRFLDHADRWIRRYMRAKQKLIKLLEEQKQAIIHRAVTRGLDSNVRLKPSGVEWLGEVPEHWAIERTKNLFRLRTQKSGIAHGMELLSIYTHIGVRPRKDLEEKGNKASTTDDYWIVKKGDLIVNKLLAWMGAVGVSEYEGVTSPADILKPISQLCSEFYHHLFRTKLYLQQFKQRSRGIMDMRLRLYFDQLGQIPVLVPPVYEQSAIVAFYVEATADLERTIGTVNREISLLREYRTRLIADVVTGKLDVREAALRLPEEVEELEPLDEVDADTDLEEGAGDDLDAAPEEAEA